MNIMLIEDDDRKIEEIKNHLNSQGIQNGNIILAKTMTDFAARLREDIGLFIIDLKLPNCTNGTPSDNGVAILESIIKAGKNDALLLAISSHPEDFPRLREIYESNGCILANYSKITEWKSTLDHLLIQIKKNQRFDFVIFCALDIERNPYIMLTKDGKNINRGGIDCYDIEIGNKKGSVILLSQMGLVNAAVTAGLCIDRFKPSIVGMSGICGGFQGRAKMGQLFISQMAYEYQSGKWTSDGFRQDPYQVATDNNLLTDLRILLSTDNLISKLEEGFSGTRPTQTQRPEIGIFTSGSAVIADQQYLTQIESIHRKVNALDMEIFAVQRAAELAHPRPRCICAKTVVDLCDSNKRDDLHLYGSYISAKFLIKAIDNA